jgi:hypothetical protein
MTLSIRVLFATFSITALCNYAECHCVSVCSIYCYAECRYVERLCVEWLGVVAPNNVNFDFKGPGEIQRK